MKDRDYVELIKEISPDIAFVIGCRILIPEAIYSIPAMGTLAVHDSLLPEYRGFAPMNWAILNCEDYTGVTLFYLSKLMDGGDIVAQKKVPIGPEDTASTVSERVCQATVNVVLDTYPLIAKGTSSRIKQNYGDGNFGCSRTPSDGMIDWRDSTLSISNQIRALTYPYPGAFSYYEGKKLKVWKADPLLDSPDYAGRIPGRVVSISSQEGHADVLTGDGVIRILEVQFEGEKTVPAAKVIKSIRDALGVRIPDLISRIENLEQLIAKNYKSEK